MIRQLTFLLGLLTVLLVGVPVQAQEPVWLQIEAQPTLREARERARAYTGVFADVSGYKLRNGWHAIVLGPHPRDVAAARLADLKREGLVPADSFLADGGRFAAQYWPPAETAPGTMPAPTPEVSVLPEAAEPALQLAPELATPTPEPAPPAVIEETPAQARAAEAALTPEERREVQTALQWFGHYTSAIDGAFGPGTRKSMAAWQEASGQEPSGVLTTLQRAALIGAYQKAQAELDLQTVTEEKAGIEITLPTALVEFDHYEPPFVHFEERNGSGVKVILISQPGDQGTLYGLYDMLQTLEVVPLDGERARSERSFTIDGRNGRVASHSYAELSKGLVKGYILIWNPKDDERMARVLAAMQASFRAAGDRALDPGLVPIPQEQRRGLLSGLEVRRPIVSRTGFYVDGNGTVLTTAEVVGGCNRITLDLGPEAEIAFTDDMAGLALLRPKKPLSPAVVAEFLTGTPRLGAEIAVSGYSYEDTLPAPTLTFGTLEDGKGLNGEASLVRLTLDALPGDAGGPVLDGAGSVLGMLLPKAGDGSRQLPASVAHALSAPAVAARLTEAGITPRASARQGALAPEDLNALASGMTVLVSCW